MTPQSNPVGSIVEETNTLTVKIPMKTGGLTHSFTIKGQVKPNNNFEVTSNKKNSIKKNGETVRAVNLIGGPKGVDSFDYRGKVVDADVPSKAEVYLNGQKVSVQNLLDYYKGDDSNGGGKKKKKKESGSGWNNPWVLISAAGVGVSALGIVQRQMDSSGGR